MDRHAVRSKILDLLNVAPALKEILLSEDPLQEKRRRIRAFLAGMLAVTFNDDPTIPPLEWVLTSDAIMVFKSILTERSERLAEFSFLQYLDDLVHTEREADPPEPTPDFLAELEHLLKGIMGKTGVYSDKIPAFLQRDGRDAAILRSSDLSSMAREAKRYLDRYPCGLEDEIIRTRSRNKSRILERFDATEYEWEDWKWQVRHIIRKADVLKDLVGLTPEEYTAVKLANKYKIPFGITPYYLSLMDNEPGGEQDRAVRAQVIPSPHYVETMQQLRESSEPSMDFMLERNTSPVDGITRRYPMIVILKPFLTCPQICVYCQRNWEIEDVYSKRAALSKEKLDKALQWIQDTPEVNEVLVTGGDPLLLSNERLENLLYRLSQIRHVERIRIGTRTPVTLPQRITDSLVRDINHFHNPGKREVLVVTHFEHPYEITPQSMEAVQKFRRYGMEVYNQLVYTFYNSRRFEAAALRLKLRLIGVTPYYTFNTKGKEETDDYRVPIARLMQEQKEEARLLPGTVRTDEIVFNVPGLGKNYLRAKQHHEVISIFPDGRRLYEFHPWEKKLFLVDTYVYKDVSIHQYLERLAAYGEDLSAYRSIWYYY